MNTRFNLRVIAVSCFAILCGCTSSQSAVDKDQASTVASPSVPRVVEGEVRGLSLHSSEIEVETLYRYAGHVVLEPGQGYTFSMDWRSVLNRADLQALSKRGAVEILQGPHKVKIPMPPEYERLNNQAWLKEVTTSQDEQRPVATRTPTLEKCVLIKLVRFSVYYHVVRAEERPAGLRGEWATGSEFAFKTAVGYPIPMSLTTVEARVGDRDPIRHPREFGVGYRESGDHALIPFPVGFSRDNVVSE